MNNPPPSHLNHLREILRHGRVDYIDSLSVALAGNLSEPEICIIRKEFVQLLIDLMDLTEQSGVDEQLSHAIAAFARAE